MSTQELEQKQKQLDDLQKSFNEFVESSKELEAELDAALEEAADKIDQGAEREAAAEKKAVELQKKIDELTKALNSKPKDVGFSVGAGDAVQQRIRELEIENEDLSNQVRILESSVESYEHRVHGLEEDLVFLRTDLEESELARSDMESELRGEVEALEKKLDISDTDRRKLSSDVAAMAKKIVDDSDGKVHDPADDRVQMLLFKQDKDIDFIKSTLDALAVENTEAHKHGHHEHHSPVWHERVEELRRQLQEAEDDKHALAEELLAVQKKLGDGVAARQPDNSEELEELYQLNIEYKREVEEHRTLTFQYESQVESLREETTRLRTELEERQDNSYQQEGDVELLNNKVGELEQALLELQRTHQALEENNGDLQQAVSELQMDKIDLNRAVSDIQSAYEDLRTAHDELQQAQDVLAAEKEELLASRDSLEQVVQELEEAKQKAGTSSEGMGSYVYGLEISSSSQSTVEINSTSTTTVNITQVINSGDKEKMKAALLRLVSCYAKFYYRIFTFLIFFYTYFLYRYRPANTTHCATATPRC